MIINSAVLVGSHLIGRVFDQGLANTLGLTTLRHGTNPISWLGVHLFGALPQMGGTKIGGDYGKGFHYQNINHFYFAKGPTSSPYNNLIKEYMHLRCVPRLLPKLYAIHSTANLLKKIALPSIASNVLGIIIGSVLPTIKFRFSEEKVENRPLDPTTPYESACSTTEWVSPLNIGIVGTIWKSLTYKIPLYMSQEPYRVITGVAQLALVGVSSYFLMLHFSAFIIAQKTAVIAGLILGVI